MSRSVPGVQLRILELCEYYIVSPPTGGDTHNGGVHGASCELINVVERADRCGRTGPTIVRQVTM